MKASRPLMARSSPLGAVLLGEPIGASLLVGVAAVALGIWIAAR